MNGATDVSGAWLAALIAVSAAVVGCMQVSASQWSSAQQAREDALRDDAEQSGLFMRYGEDDQ